MWDVLSEELTFERMDEDDLLYAIMAMDLVLRSGASIETAMEYVASHEYGPVSLEFKRIIAAVHQGEYLDKALQASSKRVRNELYSDMINAMVRSVKTSAGVANTLRQLALRESHVRRTKYRAFLDAVHGVGELFIIIGALVPLVLGVTGFTSSIMEESKLTDPLLPASVIHLGFLGTALILLIMVLYVKASAPRV
ncbi:MAG: type II secretion system F family protein [Thermoplasmata archaeon]|nr:type II secretion system F family protein [Thermoplasmata archaeon]